MTREAISLFGEGLRRSAEIERRQREVDDRRRGRPESLGLPGVCIDCHAPLVWNGVSWRTPDRRPHSCPGRSSGDDAREWETRG